MKVFIYILFLSLYLAPHVLGESHGKPLGPESILPKYDQPNNATDDDSDLQQQEQHAAAAGGLDKKLEEAEDNNDASGDAADDEDDDYNFQEGFFGENGKPQNQTDGQPTTSQSTPTTTTSETPIVEPNPLPDLEVIHEQHGSNETDDDKISLEHSIEEDVLEEEEKEEKKDKEASAQDFTGDIEVVPSNDGNETILPVILPKSSSSSSSESSEEEDEEEEEGMPLLPMPDHPFKPDLMPRPHVIFPQIGTPLRPQLIEAFGGGIGGFGLGSPDFLSLFPQGRLGPNRPPFGPFGFGQGPMLPAGAPIIINNNNNNGVKQPEGQPGSEFNQGFEPEPKTHKRNQVVIELIDSDEMDANVQRGPPNFGRPMSQPLLQQPQFGNNGMGMLGSMFQTVFGNGNPGSGQMPRMFPGRQFPGGSEQLHNGHQGFSGNQFPGSHIQGGAFPGYPNPMSNRPHPFFGLFPGNQHQGGQIQQGQFPPLGGRQPFQQPQGFPFWPNQFPGHPQFPGLSQLQGGGQQQYPNQQQGAFPGIIGLPNPFSGQQNGYPPNGPQSPNSNRRPNLPDVPIPFSSNQDQNHPRRPNLPGAPNPFASNHDQQQQGQFISGVWPQIGSGNGGGTRGNQGSPVGFGSNAMPGAGPEIGAGSGAGPGVGVGSDANKNDEEKEK